MEPGDGQFIEDLVAKLNAESADFTDFEESKGTPAIAFVPGVGTVQVGSPVFNPAMPPSSQSVPMNFGAVFSVGVMAAGVLADLLLEAGHDNLKRRELADLAASILQDGLDLEPKPIPTVQPNPVSQALRKRPKTRQKRTRILGYGR